MVETEGTPFGRYRLIERLGAGGMGVVWKAWDPELGRMVALKQVVLTAAEGAETLARFEREARTAARLRHPHIVRVIDVGVIEGRPYLTMDLVEGTSLEAQRDAMRVTRLAGAGAETARLREEVALLADVAGAVAYAHAQGVIHRDLKPGNVLVDRAGRGLVADFGLAKESGDDRRLTRTGMALGSPSYMSPEQATGDVPAIGPRSDVWSLGAILYELLVGEPPFERPGCTVVDVMNAVVGEDPVPPRRRNAAVPAELELVCLEALEKDPAGRFPSAAAFEEELRRWLRGEPVSLSAPSPGRRLARWAARHRIAALVGLLTFAVAAISSIAGWRARSSARERAATLLERIGAATADFEDATFSIPLTDEARDALARQPLGILEALLAEDAGYGPAFAWRGRVLALLGRTVEAEADFDRACELSPDQPTVWFLRGWHAIQTYADSRGLPTAHSGAGGMEFAPMPPETSAQLARKARGLADLERAAAAGGSRFGEEDRRIARGMAALARGTAAGFEEALRYLEGVERPFAWKLRGSALYPLARFAEAGLAFGQTLERWPEDWLSRMRRGQARFALALRAAGQGTDPRPGYRAALEDFDEAIKRAEWSNEAWNNRGAARLSLARAEQERGVDARPNFRGAIEDFTAASERNPNGADEVSNRGLAFLHLSLQEEALGLDPLPSLTRAIADCSESLRRDPRGSGALLNRGIARGRLGETLQDRGQDPTECLGQAIADLTAALALDPGDPAPLNSRGVAWSRIARQRAARGEDPFAAYGKSLADYDELIRRLPGWSDAWNNRGNIHIDRGRVEVDRGLDPRAAYRGAMADFEEALRLLPGDVSATHNRGLARVYLGQAEARRGGDPRTIYREAVADFGAALARNPELAPAYGNRGMARQNLARAEAAHGADPREELRGAVADLDQAIRRTPGAVRLWVMRGVARQEWGDAEASRGGEPVARWREALADFDEALRLDPGSGEAYVDRGIVHERLATRESDPGARFARALADYAEAARGNPAWATPRSNRGVVLLHQGEAEQFAGGDPRPTWSAAVAELDEAMRLAPGDLDVLTKRANALASVARAEAERGGDPSGPARRAEEDFRAAIGGGFVPARIGLAVFLHVVGRWEESESVLAEAAALPRTAGEAAGLLAQARREREATTRAELDAGARARAEGDRETARVHWERGLTALDLHLRLIPPAERAALDADPDLRALRRDACLDLARRLAASDPDAALVRLEAALALDEELRPALDSDEELAPLRADPRWAAMTRGGTRPKK